MRSRFGLWLVAFLVWSAQACGGPTFVVQQYDGPVRQRETIAVIRVRGADSVAVVAVDGSPTGMAIDSDARLHVEVLPGEHSLDVADYERPDEPARRVWFQAAPGKVYRAVWAAGQPRVFEVGDSSDAPIADVSRTSPTPLPEPVAPTEPLPPPVAAPPVIVEDAGAPEPDAGGDVGDAGPPDAASGDAVIDAAAG